MSPRKPAALRGGDGQNLREHLIATAARLIAQRGASGLAVRDIAREARVADGVLYNYFQDKDDLLAQALLAHVGTVMGTRAPAPRAGSNTVAENLREFIETGMRTLAQVAPAFAGLVSEPGVMTRFHAMVGGDAAFGADMPGPSQPAAAQGSSGTSAGQPHAGAPGSDGVTAGQPHAGAPGADGVTAGQPHAGAPGAGGVTPDSGGEERGEPESAGPRGLPDILRDYLAAEQRIGRIDRGADVEAAVTLIVGTIHGEILPRVMFRPPGSQVPVPPGLAARITATILSGIAPRPHG
jgi:AcrR family transcriptional regulator